MKRSLAFVLGGMLLSATATEAADPDYLHPDLSAEMVLFRLHWRLLYA